MNQKITEIPTTRPIAPRVALVVSRYNAEITGCLESGACEALERLAPEGEMDVFSAPGAFELVAVASSACASGAYDGVACMGCVIRGQTRHDEYINASVAHGITELTIRTGVPVAFGLLTVSERSQAEARAGGEKGNKGVEAMEALLATIASMRAVGERAGAIGAMTAGSGS